MRKIKKFKVDLRKREILRNLKLISDIREITPQIEEIIDSEIKNSKEYISPASVYSTFSQDDITLKFGPDFFPPSEQKKPLSVSFIIISIGEQIEKDIRQRQESGETIHASIMRALGLEAVESALNFVLKLVASEAKAEENEVLSPEKLNDAKAAQAINVLEAKKIGVYADEKGQVRPEFTTVAAVRWK